MATLIGDCGGADYSPFHSRVSPSTTSSTSYRPHPQQQHQQTERLQHIGAAQPQSPPLSSSSSKERVAARSTPDKQLSSANGTSRIPSPPDSSSPSSGNESSTRDSPENRDVSSAHMASTSTEVDSARTASDAPSSTSHTAVPAPSAARPPPPTNAIPSPTSDGAMAWASSGNGVTPMPMPLAAPPLAPPQRTQRTINIRDLNHIQSLAQLDISTGNGPGILNDPPLQDMKFEISAMPIGDIIEMVAALLTKITTTNDRQHDALNRNASQQRQAQAHNDGADIHSSPFSASVLAFHGKNVPAITILSYLSRIHKYCPTTYEVFLSLLVYFDRMTERVNDLVVRDEEERRSRRNRASHNQQRTSAPLSSSTSSSTAPPPAVTTTSAAAPPVEDAAMKDDNENDSSSAGDDETDEDLADSDDEHASNGATGNGAPSPPESPSLMATYFVVDSFNIHRLIIAGVTCASKFFSDVFYTNSRYAKVGGLPLAELNHLELQFLILNDFRLAIPIEDLEAYATMLVEFYAREVVGQRPRPSGGL